MSGKIAQVSLAQALKAIECTQLGSSQVYRRIRVVEKVRVGIIGVGGIATSAHIPAYQKLADAVEIVAVCDVDEKRVRRVAEQFNVPHTFTDYTEMVAMEELDAVSVCTPPRFHAPATIAALEAGKHVLCEKPLGMNFAEALTLFATAQRAGVRHMVGFTYRFVPALRYMKALIQQGVIGEPRHFRSLRLQDVPEEDLGWRQRRELAGRGELFESGCHRIDYAHYLVGEIAAVAGLARTFVPERRTGRSGTVPAEVEDWAAFVAEFKNGATGVFEVSRLAKGHRRGGQALDLAEVNGSEGTLIFDLRRPFHLQLGKPGGSLELLEVPREYYKLPGSPRGIRGRDAAVAYRFDQDFAFVRAVLSGEPCTPSFADGVRCQAVIQAVIQSAEERRWMAVPPLDGTAQPAPAEPSQHSPTGARTEA
ncbi:MAG: gfo/Idh/MocA family oxidoreductase [Chloroflexota bacterium]